MTQGPASGGYMPVGHPERGFIAWLRTGVRSVAGGWQPDRRRSGPMRRLADRHGLSNSGSRNKPVLFGNDDDAVVGHREALRIARPIKTDPLARGNRHVLVDNAALELRSIPD